MSEDTSNAGERDASISPAARVPRVSILHLLLWTLCSSVYLAISRAEMIEQNWLPESVSTLQGIYGVLQSASTGAILAGAIILVSGKVRRGWPVAGQPGHWLLLVNAAILVCHLPLRMLTLSDSQTVFLAYLRLYALLLLGSAGAYFMALRQASTLRWKFMFGCLIVAAVAQSGAYVAFGTPIELASPFWIELLFAASANFFPAAPLIVVIVLELWGHERRDWLHWTGIVTFLADVFVAAVWLAGVALLGF